MKTRLTNLLTLLFALSINTATAQTAMDIAAEMYPGWNLGNTLEAGPCSWLSNDVDYETGWQGTKTTQEIIDYVKEKGFRSVRIPCSWYIHMDSSHKIKKQWMDRVQEIVDYCIKDSLYVVLNDHYDSGWIERSFDSQTPQSIEQNCTMLDNMWQQIATRFRDYDHHLLFAGLNEPDAGRDENNRKAEIEALVKYEQTFINTVRATGGNNATRVLVVQGPCTDIDVTYESYNELPTDPTPSALMLEVHFYSPYNFCQMEKDESWGKVFYYWGANNHYSSSAHNANWGEEDFVIGQMEKMKEKFTSKGIPVYLGEYGSIWRAMTSGESQSKHNNSIYAWYKTTTQYAISNGIIPVVWDTNYAQRPSGTIINRSTLAIFDQKAYTGIMDGSTEATWPYPSATPIKNITKETSPLMIYDLQGRRLTAIPHKGIYIVGGKKVVR